MLYYIACFIICRRWLKYSEFILYNNVIIVSFICIYTVINGGYLTTPKNAAVFITQSTTFLCTADSTDAFNTWSFTDQTGASVPIVNSVCTVAPGRESMYYANRSLSVTGQCNLIIINANASHIGSYACNTNAFATFTAFLILMSKYICNCPLISSILFRVSKFCFSTFDTSVANYAIVAICLCLY